MRKLRRVDYCEPPNIAKTFDDKERKNRTNNLRQRRQLRFIYISRVRQITSIASQRTFV
jgi:hypothetical protein